jgi:KipI family sensor histidine kinase inhibitor
MAPGGEGPSATIGPFGDAAVLVELGGPVGLATASKVQHMARVIEAAVAGEPGWGSAVPAATSVLVGIDPVDPGTDAATERLRRIVETAGPVPALESGPGSRLVEIPVRYGGAEGPDLDAVAERLGLPAAGVIELHASTTYHVLFLGFAPGFGYLGVVPPALVVPRRDEPRVRVPSGSVGLAGELTAVYPIESPGGWQLIGRTEAVLWDPTRSRPATLAPGDAVRFIPR